MAVYFNFFSLELSNGLLISNAYLQPIILRKELEKSVSIYIHHNSCSITLSCEMAIVNEVRSCLHIQILPFAIASYN